jgi:predicted MFS family arabinose efflux permease
MPLAATMFIQTVLSLLNRVIPTIAPTVLPQAGLDPSLVGLFDAMNTTGAMIFLVAGTPLIRHSGNIRTLQIGLLLGVVGLGLLVFPFWLPIAMMNLLCGCGYGTSAPAGSDLLLRYSPPHRRTLIFSIKQAAVPIAGIIAGIALPFLVEHTGMSGTIAVLMVATFASAVLVQPVRERLDQDRDPCQPLGFNIFLSAGNLMTPFRCVARSARLMQMSFVAFCNSFGQSVIFAYLITYLVSGLHFDLQVAGTIFACLQVSGVVGRVLFGWLADRFSASMAILRISSLTSALAVAVLAFSSADWPPAAFILLASVSGMACASWAGICLAEAARSAPSGAVSEATSGVTLVYYIGFVLGPVLFAALLALSDSYRFGLLITAALTACGALRLTFARRLSA